MQLTYWVLFSKSLNLHWHLLDIHSRQISLIVEQVWISNIFSHSQVSNLLTRPWIVTYTCIKTSSIRSKNKVAVTLSRAPQFPRYHNNNNNLTILHKEVRDRNRLRYNHQPKRQPFHFRIISSFWINHSWVATHMYHLLLINHCCQVIQTISDSHFLNNSNQWGRTMW